ncbi:hypothetical protein PHMEG_00015556 [Phytophthora megakarya]|uniref:Uncharacterized protein n=1 Tax=Phytophthora megakarya TaxID=4795 RepID=A0A225W1H3_9STRA|nr:hypothetical protein PHMEG_00015556 [Phytophthora megakarya]
MSDTTAFKVAQVFEECTYRSISSICRDDAVKTESNSELSATGQWVARMISQDGDAVRKSLCQRPTSARLGRDCRASSLCHQHSMDTTRKETSFYLFHGWDASSTMKAMTTSLRHGIPKQPEALAWRREVNRP